MNDDKPRRMPYPYPTCPHCGGREVQRRPWWNPPEGIDYFQCRACSEVWTIRSEYTRAETSQCRDRDVWLWEGVRDRMSGAKPQAVYWLSGWPDQSVVSRLAPSSADLALEVRSPGDSRAELHSKSQAYLRQGVRLVWVLDPQDESVTVFAPGAPVVVLRNEDVLDGGDVVEGFRVAVSDLYRR